MPSVANSKIYIHELIDIVGQNRAKYMHHMTANWGPIGRTERNMLCVGVWATVGSTERWPQTVNMWELDGWQGLAANFRHEFNSPSLQDPSLEQWWAEAANYRNGGYDRILIPAPYSPTLEEALEREVRGEVYSHETVQVVPGQAKSYLAMLEQDWMPIASRIGVLVSPRPLKTESTISCANDTASPGIEIARKPSAARRATKPARNWSKG